MGSFQQDGKLTGHQSAGRQRSGRFGAEICLLPTIAVIAAATLTFAQGPTEETRSVLSSSGASAAVPAASGPTPNADAQPLQNPADDLVNEPVVSFRPNELQNRVRRLYLPILIETSGRPSGGPTAALLTRRGRRVALAIGNKASVGTTTSRAFVIPNPQKGPANPCNVASANTPASTPTLSLVDAMPNLLPFFNNAPVFGLPGTIEGNFWNRTQLIGDPKCKRTDLVRRGVFIDLYATSAYQEVTSGGLKTGASFVQNTQLSINLDTARAGLWPGGLFHFTVQSRYGSLPQNTFTAGSVAPQYTGLLLPGPLFPNDTLPSEYVLIQSLCKKFSLVIGKINGVFVTDKTLFGERFRYYFANTNFNINPIYSDFFNTTTIAFVGLLTPTPWLTIAGGAHDPHSEPNTLAGNAFQNGDVNLY